MLASTARRGLVPMTTSLEISKNVECCTSFSGLSQVQYAKLPLCPFPSPVDFAALQQGPVDYAACVVRALAAFPKPSKQRTQKCLSDKCQRVMSDSITTHHASDKYMDRVAYLWSSALQDACDQLPCNLDRSTVVHDLHRAYGLLDSSNLTVYEPDVSLGDVGHLTRFHDRDYIGRQI